MRILIADDESDLVAALSEFLRAAGHEVCAVTTGGLDVLTACDRFRPEIILMDVMMPRFNGVAISRALLNRNPAIKVVLCSGALPADHPFIANSGACHFLPKPFTFSEALRVLERLAPAARAAA